MEHFILHEEITDEHKANLKTLADYLISMPEKQHKKFSMQMYCIHAVSRDKVQPRNTLAVFNECKTIACAAGHGPMAGLPAEEDEAWSRYTWRVFGVSEISCEWVWCFSGRWSQTDNTPQGAGKRILYMLEHGVPANYLKQLGGTDKLCYQ